MVKATGKIRLDSISQKYRDEAVEIEIVSYAARRDWTMMKDVDPMWFSIAPLRDIAVAVRKMRSTVSRGAMLSYLKNETKIENPKITAEVLRRVYTGNVPSEKAVKSSLDQLVELFERRNILAGIRNVLEKVSNGRFDVTRTKQVLKELSNGAHRNGHELSVGYVEGLRDRMVLVKHRAVDPLTDGVLTGIAPFDNLSGGLIAPEYGVIAGVPASGKSVMMECFAVQAWRNDKSALYISGEMPYMDLAFRVDSTVTGIDNMRFRLGLLRGPDFRKWRSSVEQEGEAHKGFFEIASFPNGFCADDIATLIERLEQKHDSKVDLVCIDHLHLMSANQASGLSNRDWKSQEQVIGQVKQLCETKKLCVWTAVHVDEDGESAATLKTHNIKYAKAIGESAPIVVGLVRTMDDSLENVLEMQILKMRNTPISNRPIILRPNLKVMRIHEEVIQRVKSLRSIEPETGDPRVAKKQRSGKGALQDA